MRQALFNQTARPTLVCSRLSSVAVSIRRPLFDFHMEVLKGDVEWVIPLWKASIGVIVILKLERNTKGLVLQETL